MRNLEKVRGVLKSLNTLEQTDQQSWQGQDPATLGTFTFMHLMKRLAENVHWSAEDLGDHLIFKGLGRLVHSQRTISIQIYLGPTVDYQKGRRHWGFLSDALRDSDFIFYSGHAGMGYTFSFDNLKKYSDFKGFEHTPQNQFIAVLSCSSISYFWR